MSKTGEVFMKEIHQIIAESVDWAMGHVGRESDTSSPSTISGQDRASLRKITLSGEAEKALGGLMIELGRSIAFGIFSTIDGVADREGLELPDLALVERASGEVLSEGFLHDEFYEYAPD